MDNFWKNSEDNFCNFLVDSFEVNWQDNFEENFRKILEMIQWTFYWRFVNDLFLTSVDKFGNKCRDNFWNNFIEIFWDNFSCSFSVMFFQTLTICIEAGQGIWCQWECSGMVMVHIVNYAKNDRKEKQHFWSNVVDE